MARAEKLRHEHLKAGAGSSVPRPSFFQLNQVRKAHANGLPLRIIAHEDALVFRQPTTSVGSR
jgi:modification methylase